MNFCFDLCSAGTCLEGATLEIVAISGEAICRVCTRLFAVTQPYGQCVCGSQNVTIVHGDELRVREMEVD